MSRTLFSALAGVMFLAVGTVAADETKSDSTGFVQLFNGKDLTGWKTHPGDSPEVKWEVIDGSISPSGPKAGHLFSERGDYTDFIYRMEIKVADGGNSGQYFRTEFKKSFPPGYEAQINATHSDRIRTGSLYPAFLKDGAKQKEFREKYCVLDQAPHKPDEWFTQEITAVGGHIVIKVNGKTTLDYTDETQAYKKGHFAIQYHDPKSKVWIRKVEVKELSDAKK